MSQTIRSFIAIELSEEITAALSRIEEELKPKIPGAKWVKPDNIHLTLKFLGNITGDTAESVKTILEELAKNAKPFTLRLSSPGAFPSPERPRVIWMGIDKGDTESKNLADIIEDKAASFGIEKENRAFHPHLTLARIEFLKDKSLLKDAFSLLKIPQIEMTASKITLFKSTLTRDGAVYTVLYEALF